MTALDRGFHVNSTYVNKRVNARWVSYCRPDFNDLSNTRSIGQTHAQGCNAVVRIESVVIDGLLLAIWHYKRQGRYARVNNTAEVIVLSICIKRNTAT